MMDARTKKVVTVLSVAGVILVWRIAALVTRFAPAQVRAGSVMAASAEPAPALSSTSTAIETEIGRLLKAQEAVSDQPWGRDPFDDVHGVLGSDHPVAAAKPTAEDRAPTGPRIEVSGVSKSGDEWMAVIQGKIVRVGDAYEGDYRVTRITKRSITLESKGWLFTYPLGAVSPTIRRGSEQP